MKEYLKKSQPMFYQLMKNQFTSKKLPHAYLLVGNNTELPVTYLTMSLLCDSVLACEVCDDCRKVKENKYGDIIRYNGLADSIKKANIEHIQEEFKKSSLEGKAKIYILENIEKSNKEAMNALLKMLEEPIPGVYAIFSTNNKNRVLPTIQSRCQIIEIKPDNKLELIAQLIDQDVEVEAANILAQITKSAEEALDLCGERFDYMRLQVINTMEDIFKNPGDLIINTHINLLKNYKAKEDIRLFLDILVIGLKDMFHVKQKQDVVFVNHKELFSSFEATNNAIIEKIEYVLKANYQLDSNANVLLLMDSLLYRL